MPTSNADMNTMLRKRRGELEDYHYQGDGPDAAVVITAAPDDETAEKLPDNEAAEGEARFQVLEPGDADPPDKYVYALSDIPGAYTLYPPGVPCDTGTTRVALAHPATAEDLARMDEALGTEKTVEPAYEAGGEEMEVA